MSKRVKYIVSSFANREPAFIRSEVDSFNVHICVYCQIIFIYNIRIHIICMFTLKFILLTLCVIFASIDLWLKIYSFTLQLSHVVVACYIEDLFICLHNLQS